MANTNSKGTRVNWQGALVQKSDPVLGNNQLIKQINHTKLRSPIIISKR